MPSCVSVRSYRGPACGTLADYRTASRTVAELWEAITQAIDIDTPNECQNYFAAGGFARRPGGFDPARPPCDTNPRYFVQGSDGCSSSNTHFRSFIVRT